MSEDVSFPTASSVQVVRVAPEIPVFFADAAMSQTFAPGIAKFFFARYENDPFVQKDTVTTPIAQIVMPADGFVMMVAFFEHRLKTMVSEGIVTQAAIDEARGFWAKSA